MNFRILEIKNFSKIIVRFSANFFILLGYFLKFSKKLELIKPKRRRSLNQILSTKTKIKRNPLIKNNTNYDFPSIDLLEIAKKIEGIDHENKRNTEINTELLASVLNDFKINGKITDVKQGPIVTLFELTPAPGTLSSSVIRLAEDIARSMSAISARISSAPPCAAPPWARFALAFCSSCHCFCHCW